MSGGWEFVAVAYAIAYGTLLAYGLRVGWRWRQRAAEGAAKGNT